MLIDLATHGLFGHCLTKRSTIVDLGANQGDFSAAAISRFQCRVVAIEPDPNVCAMLRSRCSDVESICAAVGREDGTLQLHRNQNSQASTLKPQPNTDYLSTTSVEVMSFSTLTSRLSLDCIDLLKIDIEGFEVELLRGMTDDQIRSIPQISVELHDFNGMITSDEADQIERRLLALGFNRIALSRSNRENVLFYQPSKCGVGTIRHIWARYVTRNWIGVRRMISRWCQ